MGHAKGVGYRRLSSREREQISRWLVKKKKLRWIGRKLKRSASTMSREVRNGSTNRWTYRARRAVGRARRNASKRKGGKHKLILNKSLRKYVHERLRLQAMRISSEAIYSYLYVLPRGELKRELLNSLRRRHKRRHRLSMTYDQGRERAV